MTNQTESERDRLGTEMKRCDGCGNDYEIAGPGQTDCPYCGHDPYKEDTA